MSVPDNLMVGDDYAHDTAAREIVHGVPIVVPRDGEAYVGDLADFDSGEFEMWLATVDLLPAIALLGNFQSMPQTPEWPERYTGTVFGLEFRTTDPEYLGFDREAWVAGIVDAPAFKRFLDAKGLTEQFGDSIR